MSVFVYPILATVTHQSIFKFNRKLTGHIKTKPFQFLVHLFWLLDDTCFEKEKSFDDGFCGGFFLACEDTC